MNLQCQFNPFYKLIIKKILLMCYILKQNSAESDARKSTVYVCQFSRKYVVTVSIQCHIITT